MNTQSSVTMVTTFTVKPENQSKLLLIMRDNVENFVSKQEGVISVTYYSSLDGTRLVNRAEFVDASILEKIKSAPEMLENRAKTKGLIEGVDQRLYRRAFYFAGPSGK